MCGSTQSSGYSVRRPVAQSVFAAGTTGEDPAGHDASGGQGGAASPPPSGPNPSAFLRNLRTEMPLGRKVRLVVRNLSIKIRTRQGCCGHPGEPGC